MLSARIHKNASRIKEATGVALITDKIGESKVCTTANRVVSIASATPAVEDYAKAQNGTYLLAEIPERYGDAALPEVTCIAP